MSRGRSFTIVRQTNAEIEILAKQAEVHEWIEAVLNERFPCDDFAESLEDGRVV